MFLYMTEHEYAQDRRGWGEATLEKPWFSSSIKVEIDTGSYSPENYIYSEKSVLDFENKEALADIFRNGADLAFRWYMPSIEPCFALFSNDPEDRQRALRIKVEWDMEREDNFFFLRKWLKRVRLHSSVHAFKRVVLENLCEKYVGRLCYCVDGRYYVNVKGIKGGEFTWKDKRIWEAREALRAKG